MKKIVVIGAGFAGLTFITDMVHNKVEAELLLIEPKEYFETPVAALRGLVDVPFSTHIRKPIGELTDVSHIRAKAVELKESSVVIDSGEEISFDYAVIATGSVVRGWADLKQQHKQSIKEREDEFAALAAQIERARSIAIIGGGPIGVELAAEVAETYPGKATYLLHRSGYLLSALKKSLGLKAQRVLENMGVHVLLNQQVPIPADRGPQTLELKNLPPLETDMVLTAAGISINTDYLIAHFAGSRNKNGSVKVNRFLQMEGCTTIFAIGDVNDVPCIKLSVSAKSQASFTADTIKRILHGKQIKPYKTGKSVISLVTLGRKNGVAQLGPFKCDFLTAIKQKDLFTKSTFSKLISKR